MIIFIHIKMKQKTYLEINWPKIINNMTINMLKFEKALRKHINDYSKMNK